MAITTTAVGFFLKSLGFGFCGFRFFKAFQHIGGIRSGRRIGLLLSALFFGTAVEQGFLAIANVPLWGSLDLFYIFLVAGHLMLVTMAALGVYLALYILTPSLSPWPAVGGALALGAVLIISFITVHPQAFVDASGGVEWNMPQWLGVLLAAVIFLHMGTPLIIFTHAFLRSKSADVRTVSLIIVVTALMGIVNIATRFLFPHDALSYVRTRVFDITLVVIGLTFIAAFLPAGVISWISRIQTRLAKTEDMK